MNRKEKKNNHTDGKNLIMPACIVDKMLKKMHYGKTENISFSNNTVTQRINDMTNGVEKVLSDKFKKIAIFQFKSTSQQRKEPTI